ncbi:MAG: 16S rRNA (guanine(527)-N(7))-methyltransferase RsmG [Spirochaetia bacterium]|jgi:16S rRNA (guanine527-N7)-methyltransferase
MTGGSDASVTLRQGLERLSVPEPGRVQPLLETYLDELERWNPRFRLVKFSDRRELVVKHVLDSLAGWPAVRDAAGPRGSALDVGSGAGFPGIPLAVVLSSVSFMLLERMARRASFLKTCAVLLGLPLLRVAQADLSDAEGDYDVVTFRAVAPFDRFLHEIGKSGVRWRTAIAYKGRGDRARKEMEDVRRSPAAVCDIKLVSLDPPFLDEERCLIVATRPFADKRIVDKPVSPGYDFSKGDPGA